MHFLLVKVKIFTRNLQEDDLEIGASKDREGFILQYPIGIFYRDHPILLLLTKKCVKFLSPFPPSI